MNDLQSQINELRRSLRCSAEILWSDTALSGAVPDCFVFGIDNSTGDLYYKDENGDWQPATTGGGGGGGSFDATVEFSVNADPNDPGTTFNPNTPELTDVIYVSTIDASQWTWDGVMYNLYVAPHWGKVGDAGTNPSTNFIGTRDNQAFVIRTNLIERARFLTTGQLKLANYTVGAFTGTAVNTLSVDSSGNIIQTATLGTLWSTTGNTGLAAGVFLGTTDNRAVLFKTNNLTRASIGTTGTFSTFLDASINGVIAGQGAGTQGNTVFGNGALAVNTTGTVIVAIGVGAMASNLTGRRTVAIGDFALANNTTGAHNTVVGCNAVSGVPVNTTGSLNTYMGYNVAKFQNGDNNVAIGVAALSGFSGVRTATNSTAIGYQSLFNAQSGTNIALGSQAGASLTTGTGNIFIGNQPNQTEPGITTGNYNVIIGNDLVGLTPSLTNTIIIADGQANQRLIVDSTGKYKFVSYGVGTYTGTPAKLLAVDSSGFVIETSVPTTGFVDNETPSGAMDSVNATFTLANTPIVGSVHLYLRGLRLKPGAGYTISGTTITMLIIPDSGDELIADYRI